MNNVSFGSLSFIADYKPFTDKPAHPDSNDNPTWFSIEYKHDGKGDVFMNNQYIGKNSSNPHKPSVEEISNILVGELTGDKFREVAENVLEDKIILHTKDADETETAYKGKYISYLDLLREPMVKAGFKCLLDNGVPKAISSENVTRLATPFSRPDKRYVDYDPKLHVYLNSD